MQFLFAIAALIGIVWAAVWVSRGSLLVGSAAFLIVGYVFGFDFIHFRAGPIPLTLDRILFVGLVITALCRWREGRLQLKRLTGTDWLLLGLVGLLTASTILHPRPPGTPDGGSPMWRLIVSYWMPLVLYWIVKQGPIDERRLGTFTSMLTCLGLYLAVTAVAEVTQQWWAVFPRYIADPQLGTHFGRARGPTMMAASMGIYLTICGLALWYRCGNASRPLRLALFTLLPLFCAAIFCTYTRSAWLGAGAAMLVVMALELPKKWRRLALGGVAATGLLFASAKWDSILSFKRDVDHTASDTRHSVQQRSSFTYVSWQMFKDHPVFGCGFGRFYDKKLPYLSDRRQQVEIDSLRTLQHHNTLLSVLVETGIVAATLFVALIVSLAQSAWNVVRAAGAPAWARRFGVVMLATVATYLASAVFHDLSLSPTEHWMLFSLAGITSGLQVLFVIPKTVVTSESALRTIEGRRAGMLKC